MRCCWRWLVADGMPEAEARQLLEADYAASGARGRLPFAASGIAAWTGGRRRQDTAAPAPSARDAGDLTDARAARERGALGSQCAVARERDGHLGSQAVARHREAHAAPHPGSFGRRLGRPAASRKARLSLACRA